LACSACEIRCSKPHRAFVEIVEGSALYNFAYYRLVHFSLNFGRKGVVNGATPKRFRPGARARAQDVVAPRTSARRRTCPYPHAEAGQCPVDQAPRCAFLCVTQSGPMVGATRRSPTHRTAHRHPPLAATTAARRRPSLSYLPMPRLGFCLGAHEPLPHGALAFKTHAPFSSREHRAPQPLQPLGELHAPPAPGAIRPS
jgi:hypothetical protein